MIAVQSRINGELSDQIGSPLEASFVSFATGLIIVSLISFTRRDMRSGLKNIFRAVSSKELSIWQLTAGMLGASFVGIQTYVVPLSGVALFTVASLAGQTIISLWIDHVGFSGGNRLSITKRRIFSVIITLTGVLVSTWDRFSKSNLSILTIALSIFAGSWVGIQRSLNGQINFFSKNSFATSQINFFSGFIFLIFLFLLQKLFTGHSIVSLASGPWWMFLGGSIGVFYIAFSAVAVQSLGVLEFTLLSVGGMLFGSLLLDMILPTQGTQVSFFLILGIFLTYFGLLTNTKTKISTHVKKI